MSSPPIVHFVHSAFKYFRVLRISNHVCYHSKEGAGDIWSISNSLRGFTVTPGKVSAKFF